MNAIVMYATEKLSEKSIWTPPALFVLRNQVPISVKSMPAVRLCPGMFAEAAVRGRVPLRGARAGGGREASG